MASAEQLNQVFRFKHQRPSTRQDEASCKALVTLLCDFVTTIEPIEFNGEVFSPRDPHVNDRVVPVGKFTVKELKELTRVCRQLRGEQDLQRPRGDKWVQEWLPAYGCVLEVERVNATSMELRLVFLDGWELELHTLPDGEMHHSAVSKTFNVLHCGRISGKLLTKLHGEFHRRLMEAKQRTGNKRNAAANEEGHQKTPQFIAALLLKAHAAVSNTSQDGIQPRGGTTDVGLHTGGSARDTCWPLVRAVLEHNLGTTSVLAEKCVVHFELALLGKQLRLLKSKPKQCDSDRQSLWASADEVFEMLTKIVLTLIHFLECGYDIALLRDQCERQRKRLNAVIEAVNNIHAAQYTMPLDQDIALLSSVWRCPKLLSEPVYLDPYQLMGARSMSESELNTNLGFCELIDLTTCSTSSLIQWLSYMDTAVVEGKIMLVLSTIEDVMFRASQFLVDQTSEAEDLQSPSTVNAIVQVYELYIVKWHNQPISDKVRCMEQQSHELLVLWIAFCLAHQDCARSCDHVNQYGIALDWQRLDVLVLSEKSATDAMKNVAIYIRTWNERSKPPLFHLNNQSPTFDFALAVAKSTGKYSDRHLHEMNWRQTKIATLWRTIEAKKQEAERLRAEIQRIMTDLATENATLVRERARLDQLNADKSYYHRRRKSTPEIGACNSRINALSGKLSSRERWLREALVMPSYIVSPVPEQRNEALSTLFFLDMPNDIGILAHLCLSAQRALGPRKADLQLQQAIAGATCDYTWLRVYNNYTLSSERFSSQFITAFPGMFRLPRQYGPTSVDDVHSETDVARECVWYPQFGGTLFLWNDLSGQSVNPYNISGQISIEYFTETLPSAFQSLQWAVAYPGGKSRGNMVYSKLDDQPADDFDRSSYLTFGSLRAFPNQQVRKLCCALKDNQLPWSNRCVKVLVRQAMFQIGDLTNERDPHMTWKTDFLQDEGLLVFFQSMDQAATRIELTPRDYECVPLLSELAGYLSQFMPQAFSIAKRFGAIARRWADEAKFDRRSEKYAGTSDELRVKECLLYGYAICCYRLGPLHEDTFAVLELCELIILFANSKKFIGKNTTVDTLQLEVEIVMKTRIVSIVSCVMQDNPNNVLTSLLHLVNPSAPSDMIWKPIGTSLREGLSSCFQSHDPRLGVSYAINLMNGCVLTDGYSSDTLPLAMRQLKKYKELFGRRNFEVNTVRGVYRTKDSFGGWYFDFFMENDELLVQKVRMDDDCQQTLITMQLCKSSWVEQLSETLPLRLQEMHSHWYWLEKRCVLFLPKEALANNASFVIGYKENNPSKCYDVSTAPGQSYEQLVDHLTQCDFFVCDILNIAGILSKFEPNQFIHALQTPHGKIVFELPRFRLCFWINDKYELESTEYKGYVLSRNQQLVGVFPRFSRYLVLALSDSSDITRPHLRLLVPEGVVVNSTVIDIHVSNEPCAKLCVIAYDEHLRLKSFQAESISARLQLAAIYASTGTSIPDAKLNMTGIEAALQTLRQCRSSRPFTPNERKFVLNLCTFCFREPAMKLMLSMMVESSHRLFFLAGEEHSFTSINCHFEKDEYIKMCKQTPTRNPWRVRLRDAEEQYYFASARCRKNSFCVCGDGFVDLLSIPVQGSYVSEVESMLTKLICFGSSPKESHPFPLKLKQKNVLRDEMNEELRLSWDIYHSQDEVSIQASSVASLSSFFRDSLSDVTNKRSLMEQYLQRSILRAREDTCSQLQNTINYLPTLTIQDILRCAFDDHALLELAPRFSASSRLRFKQAALIYMELCVLEDKLGRLAFNAGKNPPPPEAYFIDELKTVRQWKTIDYPYWLAFEVEGQLQIRHEQLVIAKHLIKNPSAVCQLNMGRGKTRVILPMLFLYFNTQSSKIVRAHFLSPLLSETRNFMHRYLSAGTVGLHFFEQPFHRKIELDVDKIDLMKEALEEIQSCGGFLIVAPEYRLSLELKRWQLSDSKSDGISDTLESLDALLQNDQYIDVLDECDAILHHKYHLVYAMGFPQKLENGSHRWIAAQSLLHAISRSQSSRIAEMLKLPNVCSRKPEYDCRLGAFDGLRLATNLEDELKFRAQLKEAFANDLIDFAPFELSWLSALGKVARKALVQVLADPKSSIDPLVKYIGSRCYRNELLALRGLIAFGIMEHCLEKRHRVDYGLPEPESRPKMLAIPFRAADIPSERSEFSHPDVGIVLTFLAYYHSGLRESEIKRTFQILLDLDVSEQETHYSAWYKSVKDRLSVDEQKMLSSVEFISLDDPRTLSVLCRVYKYAMEVINFYLRMSVFPRDTTQYPQRISRSAWNLTTGDMNIGFSGTNDNHRLLPSAVTQLEPNEPSLRGTNGKMVDLILKVCQGYEVISQDDNSVIAWEALLNMALAKKSHALIDTGAILAGVFNHDAALFLLKQDEFSYSGVTYYDTRPDWDCWVVLEREQRVITPLKKSSTLEKDTFVIFDEARSRGSDMKLYPHAKAVLTLGPKLTKDKLMQGAGRMRQLGCDQSLWIMSMNEVAQSILKSSELCDMKQVTAIDILNWIMDNTRSEAIHGLLEWAGSGLHFNRTQINPNAELVDEDWSLKTLYEAAQDLEMIANIVRARVQRIYGDGEETGGIVNEICKKAHRYGMDDEVFVAVHSEECEREFQVEKILQLEENEVVKNCVPHSEKPWDYKCVLSARSVKMLPCSVIETRALETFVQNSVKPAGMSQISWSSSNIVGTVNFFSTIVVKSAHRGAMNEFARVIDAFLLFPDNSVLLLSEFEADHILELFWNSSSRVSCRFLNLSYTLDSINWFEREQCDASHVPRSLGSPLNYIPLTAIATCSLFNGDVKFGKRRSKRLEEVVRKLLESLSQREATLQEFVALRGYAYTWSRSFLHELSHVMDLTELTKHKV